MADLMRLGPLAGRIYPPVAGFCLEVAPVAARLNLHADPAVAAGIIRAFGCEPPQRLRATHSGGRTTLWLGPDEWLLITGDDEAFAAPATSGAHSLVDVSHRQIGLRLSGSRAAIALNGGCPLDLDLAAFPVSMAARTVFAKAEIILWRMGAEEFRLDVGRSFADYVATMVSEAARLAPTD